jgi:predicted dehydrogenase
VRHSTTRRDFLKATSLTALGLLAGGRANPAFGYPLNEKLHIGIVGVGGRGAGNLGDVSSQSLVALCDVDDRSLAAAAKGHPDAKTYHDYRKLLDQKDIDAVVVSTPDHTHAVASVAAMKSGRHVYCEKPLAHSLHEVRTMRETAKALGRVTQMGTQIHAGGNYRRVVELVQTGAVGAVRECHVWCGKDWGGGERPKETPPVPEHLHYDLWLGPAPHRPYHPVYLPSNWRRWWDFGGGTLADMGCHYMDLAFWALGLGYPLSAAATGSELHPETCPTWLVADWEFPARPSPQREKGGSGELAPCKLAWYDGQKGPQVFRERLAASGRGELPAWGDGVLFVGDKGMLIADYGNHRLLPEKDFEGFVRPDPFIPDSIGHHAEWIQAAKEGGTTTCNFEYSGTLTETVLLGTVAFRTGKRIEWDGGALRATSCPEAEKHVHPAFRDGWAL